MVRPGDPFVDWVIRADPRKRALEPEIVRSASNAYLLPEFDVIQDSWDWIEANCGLIFEMELNGWYTDESLWPADRSWSAFRGWCDLEFVDLAWDLVDAPLSSDAPRHGG